MWYGRDAPDEVVRHLDQVEHQPVPPELSMMFPELDYTRKTRRCVGPMQYRDRQDNADGWHPSID